MKKISSTNKLDRTESAVPEDGGGQEPEEPPGLRLCSLMEAERPKGTSARAVSASIASHVTRGWRRPA